MRENLLNSFWKSQSFTKLLRISCVFDLSY
jgi:hypothetical protein